MQTHLLALIVSFFSIAWFFFSSISFHQFMSLDVSSKLICLQYANKMKLTCHMINNYNCLQQNSPIQLVIDNAFKVNQMILLEVLYLYVHFFLHNSQESPRLFLDFQEQIPHFFFIRCHILADNILLCFLNYTICMTLSSCYNQ